MGSKFTKKKYQIDSRIGFETSCAVFYSIICPDSLNYMKCLMINVMLMYHPTEIFSRFQVSKLLTQDSVLLSWCKETTQIASSSLTQP